MLLKGRRYGSGKAPGRHSHPQAAAGPAVAAATGCLSPIGPCSGARRNVAHQPISFRGFASPRRGAAVMAAPGAGPGGRRTGRKALPREKPAERRTAGRRTGAVALCGYYSGCCLCAKLRAPHLRGCFYGAVLVTSYWSSPSKQPALSPGEQNHVMSLNIWPNALEGHVRRSYSSGYFLYLFSPVNSFLFLRTLYLPAGQSRQLMK